MNHINKGIESISIRFRINVSLNEGIKIYFEINGNIEIKFKSLFIWFPTHYNHIIGLKIINNDSFFTFIINKKIKPLKLWLEGINS